MKLKLLAALLLLAASAPAGARSPKTRQALRSEADAFYQSGIDRYAAGRYAEALAAFDEALRRDPGDRAARIAANRVRAELAMEGTPRTGVVSVRETQEPEEATVLERVLQAVRFEVTVGDERERLGRAQAMQGRIAQLLAERRNARSRGLRFAKEAELHALSRRLS